MNKREGITFIDLFAGIGGFRLGFEQACNEKGILPKCVFSSEIKEHALKVYKDNFGNHIVHGDITNFNEKEIPDFDVLLAGFPCQSFSSAGKRMGFLDTRGTLFFHIERILREKKPEAFILENVEGLVTHDKEDKKKIIGRTFETILSILEGMGYRVSYKILNAKNVGLAQDRKRIVIVGTKNKFINLDEIEEKHKPLNEFLERDLKTMDTKLTKLLFSHFSKEKLYGKSVKDKRGGSNNIHSWDIGLKGEVSLEQKELLEKLLRERRKRTWAKKKEIPWMDGMPLTIEEIKTFYDKSNLKGMLDDLVSKGYLAYEPPKNISTKKIGETMIQFRKHDWTKEKGYNIITGKLSFEISKILDPKNVAPTLVATDLSKLAVIDGEGLRRLSLREGLRLFGFPENFKMDISTTKGYDLLGNTIAVPMVRAVSKRLLSEL